MLVLSRKPEESVIVAGDIRITVLGIRGSQVRLGIEAPGTVKILRAELAVITSVEVDDAAPPAACGSAAATPVGPPLQSAMRRTGHAATVVPR